MDRKDRWSSRRVAQRLVRNLVEADVHPMDVLERASLALEGVRVDIARGWKDAFVWKVEGPGIGGIGNIQTRKVVSKSRTSVPSKVSPVHVRRFFVTREKPRVQEIPDIQDMKDLSMKAEVASIDRVEVSCPTKPKFIRPVDDCFVSSHFGMRGTRHHNGVDLAAEMGAEIVASDEGEVVFAGYDGPGFGNLIEIRHPDGWSTLYAHLDRTSVQRGQIVRQGERIGCVGSTGRSTGPHLHFEIRDDEDIPHNPLHYVPEPSYP